MMAATPHQIDMVRLAALVGRLDAGQPAACTVDGCVHEHGAAAPDAGERAAVLAA